MPLYERRIAKSLLQKELAQILGVCTRTVSAWETKARVPSAPHRRALADVLGGLPSDYDESWPRKYTPDLIDEARTLLSDALRLDGNTEGLPPFMVWLNEKSVRMLEQYLRDPDHPDDGEFRFMLYSAHQLADYWARQPGGDPFADVRERAIRFYDTVMHLSQ